MHRRVISFLNCFSICFVIGFIVTLPTNYFIFFETGNFLISGVCGIINPLFGLNLETIYSDSIGMYYWVFLLTIGSLFISTLFLFFRRTRSFERVNYWFYRFCAYYLALTLLIYGFNKVFKHQFFFPESNTIFTPLGQLSPDILYWSTMGTSYSYSIFAGLIEIIPALLLFFNRTRVLGALIALGVLSNVFMINFGFNISVKIYSLFLISLTLILLYPHFNRMTSFFLKSETVPPHKENYIPQGKWYSKAYPFLKALIIVLILLEVLGPYFKSNQFNGDRIEKNSLHGAYTVKDNPQHIKRVFFHQKGYFIVQNEGDIFIDYTIDTWYPLQISNEKSETTKLIVSSLKSNNYILEGSFFGEVVNWHLQKIELSKLPVYQNQIQWVTP